MVDDRLAGPCTGNCGLCQFLLCSVAARWGYMGWLVCKREGEGAGADLCNGNGISAVDYDLYMC